MGGISGQSVGRDYSWIINTAQGQLQLPANFITKFEAKPDAKLLKYMPTTGTINPLVFPEGYMIDMEVARVGNTIEVFWATYEAAYYAGVDQPGGSIFETISEPNGQLSQFIYTNVQLKVDTFGDVVGNNYVSPKLSGYAARFQITS